MYESFYGLTTKPFSLLPDPEFLYLGKKHKVALALLEYALMNNAGFCVITGEIGAGKTTLLRRLLGSIEENITVGMITNTHQSFGELLDWVLSAFGIHQSGLSKVEMHQRLVDFLLEQYASNKTTLLIVDEAQLLDESTLEEIRLLLNFQLNDRFLLSIILIGQPELGEKIREIEQLNQRIAIKYHLIPFDFKDNVPCLISTGLLLLATCVFVLKRILLVLSSNGVSVFFCSMTTLSLRVTQVF